jgi:hypothetical protein
MSVDALSWLLSNLSQRRGRNGVVQMKKILLSAGVMMFTANFAMAEVLISEKIPTTFSLSSLKLEDVLKCTPGYRGGYATGDSLTLEGFTISTGLSTAVEKYMAESSLGLENDPPNSHPSRRPYKEGCQLAIDKITAHIKDKEFVEVTINRSVQKWDNSGSLVRRDLHGDVHSVKYQHVDTIIEFLNVDLAGFDFYTNTTVNMDVRPF